MTIVNRSCGRISTSCEGLTLRFDRRWCEMLHGLDQSTWKLSKQAWWLENTFLYIFKTERWFISACISVNIWILTWFKVDHFTLRVIGSKKRTIRKNILIHSPDILHDDNKTDEDLCWDLCFPSSVVNLSHSYFHLLLRFFPIIPLLFPLSLLPNPRRERQMAHSGKVRWGGDKGSSRRTGDRLRKGCHKCWVGGGLMEEKRGREKLNEGKAHDQMIRGRWQQGAKRRCSRRGGRGCQSMYGAMKPWSICICSVWDT